MNTPKVDEAAVFNAARPIEAPEPRRLYLQESCADDRRLLARVEALLRGHEEERSFLEAPAVAMVAAVPLVHEGPGVPIGPYKLLEQIGEGASAWFSRPSNSSPCAVSSP